jgi:hypothetical protein
LPDLTATPTSSTTTSGWVDWSLLTDGIVVTFSLTIGFLVCLTSITVSNSISSVRGTKILLSIMTSIHDRLIPLSKIPLSFGILTLMTSPSRWHLQITPNPSCSMMNRVSWIFSNVPEALQELRTNSDATQMRQFFIDSYGSDWTQKNLGFSTP